HSIRDPEPKYGMAVTGLVAPDRLTRNSGMRPGDVLYLTKPLGLGLISTAIKAGRATDEQVRLAVDTMTTLNAGAAEAMGEAGAGRCPELGRAADRDAAGAGGDTRAGAGPARNSRCRRRGCHGRRGGSHLRAGPQLRLSRKLGARRRPQGLVNSIVAIEIA